MIIRFITFFLDISFIINTFVGKFKIMSKKKFKDDFERFVDTILKRKRKVRPYTIPRDYLEAVADSIHRTNPTKEIIVNTLIDVYSTCFEKCYERFITDNSIRRAKKEQRFEADWKKFKDEVDDLVNNKPKKA